MIVTIEPKESKLNSILEKCCYGCDITIFEILQEENEIRKGQSSCELEDLAEKYYERGEVSVEGNWYCSYSCFRDTRG